MTLEDAPTWLIHDLHDGLAWRRVPDTVEPLDLVDARLTAATRTPRRCCAGCRALHPILGLAAATAAATRSCCRSCSGRSVPNEQAAADCGGTGRQERSRVVVFSCQPSSARMASSRQRGRCWRSAHSGPGPLEPVLTEARRASTGPDRFAQFDGRTWTRHPHRAHRPGPFQFLLDSLRVVLHELRYISNSPDAPLMTDEGSASALVCTTPRRSNPKGLRLRQLAATAGSERKERRSPPLRMVAEHTRCTRALRRASKRTPWAGPAISGEHHHRDSDLDDSDDTLHNHVPVRPLRSNPAGQLCGARQRARGWRRPRTPEGSPRRPSATAAERRSSAPTRTPRSATRLPTTETPPEPGIRHTVTSRTSGDRARMTTSEA